MSSSEEELTSSGGEEPTDRSFGEQFLDLLNQPIPEGKCPILSLSKIPSRIQQQMKEQKKKSSESTSVTMTKKVLLNKQHQTFDSFVLEKESRLRKSATKGVISLFSQISKAQNKAPIVEEAKNDEAPKDANDFLNMLSVAALKQAK